MNNVVLSGRISKDLFTEKVSGRDKVTLTLAVRRDFKNPEGKYDADFIRCIAWGNNAAYLNSYAKKGSLIEVMGQIRTGSYSKNGQTVYTTDVNVEKATVLSSASAESSPKVETTQTVVSTSDINIADDELPFDI